MSVAPAEESRVRVPQISQKMSVGRASVLLSLMILLSRITGFGRLMVTSHLYGISPVTDAYNAAFNIPDTISILIAGGALATGFVPVFTGFLARGETAEAQRTFRAMWTLLGGSFGLITVLLFVLTYTPLGASLAPANASPAVVDLYVRLLRILLVAQFCFVLGGLFSGTLNALRLFWFAAVQPVVFNTGIIVFGLLGPQFGYGIESQAWGALFGAIIGSLLIQIPAITRQGLSLRPLFDLNDAGVRQVLKSLGPIVFGLSSGQLIALSLPRFFAAKLSPGDVTALDNANRLMQLPLAIFASGPAIALFPTLSLLAAQDKPEELRQQLASASRRTLLLMLWAGAMCCALGVPGVRLLLEHGKFGPEDTARTGVLLAFYGLGLAGLGAQQFFARGFYALGDNLPPVRMGLMAMAGFFVAGALALATGTRLGGANLLAGAASLCISLLAVGMYASLRRKLGGWDEGQTGRVLMRGAVCALASYVVAWGVVKLSAPLEELRGSARLLARIGVLVVGAACGGGTFVAAAKAMGIWSGLKRGSKGNIKT